MEKEKIQFMSRFTIKYDYISYHIFEKDNRIASFSDRRDARKYLVEKVRSESTNEASIINKATSVLETLTAKMPLRVLRLLRSGEFDREIVEYNRRKGTGSDMVRAIVTALLEKDLEYNRNQGGDAMELIIKKIQDENS